MPGSLLRKSWPNLLRVLRRENSWVGEQRVKMAIRLNDMLDRRSESSGEKSTRKVIDVLSDVGNLEFNDMSLDLGYVSRGSIDGSHQV
jgi:hypothetical protein